MLGTVLLTRFSVKDPLSFLFLETSRRSEKLSSSLTSVRPSDDKACVDGSLDRAIWDVAQLKLVTTLAVIRKSAAMMALLDIFFGTGGEREDDLPDN